MTALPEVTCSIPRHRVVVIGSGFGGLNAVKKLKRADVDVTLISRTNHHLFQPLLYQVATGILSEGEIAPATREILRRQGNAKVVLGDVQAIDLQARTVTSTVADTTVVTPYDSLIVAAGASTSYFGNDRFELEFAPGLKSIDDALELRGKIFGAFELAEIQTDPAAVEELLTFIVVGAGPTGVEMAGQIAELAHRRCKGSAHRHAQGPDHPGGRHPGGAATFGDKLGARGQAAQDARHRDPAGARSSTSTVGASRRGRPRAHRQDRLGRSCGRRASRRPRSAASSPIRPAQKSTEPAGSWSSPTAAARLSGGLHPRRHGGAEQLPRRRAGRDAGRQVRGRPDHAAARRCRAPKGPFQYFDKGGWPPSRGSTRSRDRAAGFSGFIAWMAWLVMHLVYLVGFKTKVSTLLSWTVTFLSTRRGQLTITEQQAFARTRLEQLAVFAAEAHEGETAKAAS